jgi:hypothetical protein
MRAFSILFLIAATLVFALPDKAVAQADWAVFWQKFKSAVAKNDKKIVLALSHSPQMPKDYNQLFGTASKRKCFATAKPAKDEQNGYSVFCGEQGYYFKKVNGQFRFTESFAND